MTEKFYSRSAGGCEIVKMKKDTHLLDTQLKLGNKCKNIKNKLGLI